MSSDVAKRRIGRPLALTPEVQRIILENVAAGATLKDSAEAAGVSYVTLNESRHRPELADFAAALTRAQSQMRSLIAKSLASNPDWRAQAWYLERVDREAWGKRETLEHEFAELKGRKPEEMLAEIRTLVRKESGSDEGQE